MKWKENIKKEEEEEKNQSKEEEEKGEIYIGSVSGHSR